MKVVKRYELSRIENPSARSAFPFNRIPPAFPAWLDVVAAHGGERLRRRLDDRPAEYPAGENPPPPSTNLFPGRFHRLEKSARPP